MAAIHVVHVLYSLGTGGLEKGLTTLIARSPSAFRHSVVCLSTSGEMAALLPPGTPVFEMHKPPGNSPRFVWRLARKLADLRPDVVHTRNWGGLDGVIAARLAGHRHVVHGEHGWEMGDALGASRRRRVLRKLLSRWVDEYTCVSRHLERWLADEVGIRRPITQIYNGVDASRFSPGRVSDGVRAELGLETGAFVVAIVGRLDPIKDHATLFRAFAKVRASLPRAVLMVVGAGPEELRLRELAGEGVRFLGNRPDVPELLRTASVFALTSLNEGISNTILEAMATGLPIVATRTGGNPELVESDAWGVLVEPGDDRAIAEALARYAAEPELAQAHGRASRERVLRRFSIEQMIEAYGRVWTRTASGGT